MTELTMFPANESQAMYECYNYRQQGNDEMRRITHDNDRSLFVKNLGILLSQTREGIAGCEFVPGKEEVIIHFNDGDRVVNVNMDSYIAIIRDVCREV